jgi:hypothetical protein
LVNWEHRIKHSCSFTARANDITLHLALRSADQGPRKTGYERSSVAISNIVLGDHCIKVLSKYCNDFPEDGATNNETCRR